MIDRLLMAANASEDASAARMAAMAHGLGYEIPECEAAAYLTQNESAHRDAENAHAAEAGRLLAVAAPLLDVNPASSDAEIALCYFRRVCQAITVAQRLQARFLIFKSPYSPLYRANGVFPKWIQACADFWKQIIDQHLGDAPLTVLMANVMEESPELLLELATRVDSLRFRLCIDAGAASVFSQAPALDWLDALQQHAAYVRIGNTDGKTLEARPLDQGVVDIPSFVNHLTLLPQRFNASIVVSGARDPLVDYHVVLPYFRLQKSLVQTKSMLL